MYYGVSICLVSFASGLSVVTLNIYHRGVRGSAVPKIIRSVVLNKLAPLVFMKFEAHASSTRHRNSQMQVSVVLSTNSIYCFQIRLNEW